MGVDWGVLSTAIGKTYVVSGLIPLALGGAINALKLWTVGEDDFRRRITLLRETLVEKQASALAVVLTQAQSLRPISEIREADGGDDPIVVYIKAALSCSPKHRMLERLLSHVRVSYTALMWTIVLSLISLLLAIVVEDLRPALAAFCYVLVVGQVFVLLYLRRLKNVLERDEDSI